MNRRDLLRTAGLGAAALALPKWLAAKTGPSETIGKPNFIVIYIDDLGYGEIGPFGQTKSRTPNLDRMASEGMKLTSFYAAPLCTASRTTLMTGCYAKRVGMPMVLGPANATGLSHSEKTIAELLKPLGYATQCVGKWHLGDQPEFLPTRRGFDHYLGLPYSNDMGPYRQGDGKAKPNTAKAGKKVKARPPLPLLRDDTVVQAVSPTDQDNLTAQYTDEAVKFIKANKDRPFFLYFPHTAVHSPWHPGLQFKGRSGNGDLNDWIEETDWSVGQVLDTVRNLKLGERTLVLFTSDNGGPGKGRNGPLRGGKGSTWEGGMREPTLAWWPGKIPAASVCNELACTLDVLPTLVKLAGGKLPSDRIIDGKDIRPLLFGEPGARTPHEAFCYFKGNQLEAVRSGPWKLRLKEKALYNLEADIGESKNVAAAHPDVVERLQALAQKMDGDLGINKTGPGCRPSAKAASPKPLIQPGQDPEA